MEVLATIRKEIADRIIDGPPLPTQLRIVFNEEMAGSVIRGSSCRCPDCQRFWWHFGHDVRTYVRVVNTFGKRVLFELLADVAVQIYKDFWRAIWVIRLLLGVDNRNGTRSAMAGFGRALYG
jgi:hypothetical protein